MFDNEEKSESPQYDVAEASKDYYGKSASARNEVSTEEDHLVNKVSRHGVELLQLYTEEVRGLEKAIQILYKRKDELTRKMRVLDNAGRTINS